MDHDNLVAGVAPGGFQDVYEVRILICYILYSVNEPLSKDQLHCIFSDNNLVNYFTFSNALAQLLEEHHITATSQNGNELYTLNQLGVDTAQLLQNSLPRSVRDRVVSAALELLSKQKKERENEVQIERFHDGYNVHFVIHDTDFDLLTFTLFVPDQIQADIVKKKFLQNPAEFYTRIIGYLTQNKESAT